MHIIVSTTLISEGNLKKSNKMQISNLINHCISIYYEFYKPPTPPLTNEVVMYKFIQSSEEINSNGGFSFIKKLLVHFHYTPINASWLNQVEVFFSILSRGAIQGAALNQSRGSAEPETSSSQPTTNEQCRSNGKDMQFLLTLISAPKF